MTPASLSSDDGRFVAWCPQPGPQTALVSCPVEDVFYGGARGGGKTYGSLGEFAIHGLKYRRHARGVLFRRTLDELEEVESAAHTIYGRGGLGGDFKSQKRLWTLPGGATIRFRSLENLDDARKHQGRAYTRVYFDELGNFADPKPFDLLWGSLRSAKGVPCRRISTGNPGGPGHVWVKARYITPIDGEGPKPWIVMRRRPIEERPDLEIEQVFIPSTLENNLLLHLNDPGYERRLAAVGGAKLFRAWRMGDWDAIEGQYFDCFNPFRHVMDVEAMPIEPWHRQWIAMDWGFEHPASIGFFASDGKNYFLTRTITVHHHDVAALARLIVTQCAIHEQRGEQFKAFYLSPDAFATESDSMSVAGRLSKELRPYGFPAPTAAVTDRVNGWRAVYDLMKQGRLTIGSTCSELLRLFPAAIHDPDHPEDLLKFDGDDPLDMLRYGVMTAMLRAFKPFEEKVREAVADRKVDLETGEVTLAMPTNPNVLALRTRMRSGAIRGDGAPIRPRGRG